MSNIPVLSPAANFVALPFSARFAAAIAEFERLYPRRNSDTFTAIKEIGAMMRRMQLGGVWI